MKTSHESRVVQAPRLLAVAEELGIRLDPALHDQIVSGFGQRRSGEDAFDAVVGLFGMINVLAGNRPDGPPADDPGLAVEGWILGQRPVADELAMPRG